MAVLLLLFLRCTFPVSAAPTGAKQSAMAGCCNEGLVIASVGAWLRVSAGHACSGGRGCSHAALSSCAPVNKSVDVGEYIFVAEAGHSVPSFMAGQSWCRAAGRCVDSCWNAAECGADWRHCWLSPTLGPGRVCGDHGAMCHGGNISPVKGRGKNLCIFAAFFPLHRCYQHFCYMVL